MDYLWKILKGDWKNTYGVFEKFNSDGSMVKLKIHNLSTENPVVIQWFNMEDVEKVM